MFLSTQPKSSKEINRLVHGGAYIPATVQVEGPREVKKAVLDKVRTFLAECENGGLMTIDIEN